MGDQSAQNEDREDLKAQNLTLRTVPSTHIGTAPVLQTARPLEQEGGSNKDGTRTIRDQQ